VFQVASAPSKSRARTWAIAIGLAFWSCGCDGDDGAVERECRVSGCDADSETPVCDRDTDVCVPLLDLGASCRANVDCVTGRCGDFTHTCEILAGQACAGMERFCGEECKMSATLSVCMYTCNESTPTSGGCDHSSMCLRDPVNPNDSYCAFRCTTPGTACPFGGTCRLYDDADGDNSDEGPWCLR
jgi:hypothetical protein